MTWIIAEGRETVVENATVENDELWLSDEATYRATGWQIKPEGLCRGDVCIPVPADREIEFKRDNLVNLTGFWRHMGRPAVSDATHQSWVFGPSARDHGQALTSLRAPDFELPDLTGKKHRFSDQSGKKILLATWASW